ncbi:hypothetical protein C8Q76DRAFT_578456, partial [Earliella scabrosa]
LMRSCGAVVSGSAALRFFLQNATWEPRDLDIYVPEDTFRDFVDGVTSSSSLMFHQLSGAVSSWSPSPEEVANGIREVLTFETRTGRRVDVIRSPTDSPIIPLNFYWTTLVMNFIVPDGYFCGYPLDTLAGRGVVRS